MAGEPAPVNATEAIAPGLSAEIDWVDKHELSYDVRLKQREVAALEKIAASLAEIAAYLCDESEAEAQLRNSDIVDIPLVLQRPNDR